MQWRLLASFATSLIRLYIRVKFSKIFHFRTPGLKFCLFRLQTTILVNANISNSILISFRHLWFISEQILGIDTSYHQIRICFVRDGNTKLCVLIFLFKNWHSVCFTELGATSIEKIPKISASGRNFLEPLPPLQKRALPMKTSVFRT